MINTLSTMYNIKLYIVIPCYNVEKTIQRALDSILMQQASFEWECIAVNDASTDATGEILREYVKTDNRIRLLENEDNQGNAKTFKKGVEASRGNYLCVLDGDDFYTVRDKLQRQVDFLDGDRESKYAAVAHKYLTLYPNGTIKKDWRLFSPASEHSYLEFITRHFYCHTSTMMYRNVFRGMKIPILMTQRGDTIRTLIAMNASYGKIKILNFIGSVYVVNPNGIWSALDQEGKKAVDIETWKSCARHVESDHEKRIIRSVVKRIGQQTQQEERNSWFSDSLLSYLSSNIAGYIAFKEKDFIFRKLYKSDFIDSFCESLGRIRKDFLGIVPSAKPDQKNVAIVISALTKTGGGVYQEILELVIMLQSKHVSIMLTDMEASEFTEDMKADFARFKKLSFVFLKGMPDRLTVLMEKLSQLNAGKIYWYCGHNNTWANAAIQDYGGKNIVPFSFDHGLSLGLSNTNIDLFITKTPKDYKLLSGKFGNRTIYVPCWSIPANTERKYEPLAARERLNTATAAARFYKYQGDILCSFQYFIVNLIKATCGKHVHYGPLPDEVKDGIVKALERQRISPESFIHIEWANNLPDSMLTNGVDLFISPFPISSIKLNLQCLSAGIPVMVYAGGLTRIEQNDFLNQDVLKWRDREEFFGIVTALTRKRLVELSASGLEYFRTHNDLSVAMPHILFDKCFSPVPIPPPFIDAKIIDAEEILDLIAFAYEN